MSTHAKVPIKYVGPFPEVSVPVAGGHGIRCARGQTVECPKDTADDLLKSQPGNWEGSTKAPKKEVE